MKHPGHVWPTRECGRTWCAGISPPIQKGPIVVYEKNRSGDPDFDDKQPPEFHAGGAVVSAGDGVRITETTGPVDANGAHVNLATTAKDLDNRPAPGQHAEAGSLVQDYDVKDTPAALEEAKVDSGELSAIKASQESVQASNLANSGVPGMAPDVQEVAAAETPTTPAKAKSTNTGTAGK